MMKKKKTHPKGCLTLFVSRNAIVRKSIWPINCRWCSMGLPWYLRVTGD